MSKDKGWISLHRKFLNWEWYDDANVMRLFIHLLLSANHENNKWRGKLIKRGQLITSHTKLANALKLTISQVRSSLNNLKLTGEIAVQPTAEYSVISIKNFDLYQVNRRPNDTQNANQIATNNNNNKREIINNLSLAKISKKEREILKKYITETSKRKIDDFDAYIRKLIDNGDYLLKLEKAKKRLEKQKTKENIPPKEIQQENIEEVEKARAKTRAEVEQIKKRRENDSKNSS